MMVAHNVVHKRAVAFGAGRHIIYDIVAFLFVRVKVVDAEIHAVVFGLNGTAKRVVAVQNKLCALWNFLIQNIEDKLRVRVALIRITENVRAQHNVRLHVGVNVRRRALIELKHRKVTLRLAEKVTVRNERRCHAGRDIRAGAVAHELDAVILQNILDHIRDSRFAVRARNADDLLRFRHAPDKIRAQNNSPRTRHGRALSPDEL